MVYTKTCVKRSLSKRPKLDFQDQLSLKDTDFDKAAHATCATSVNKLTSTSKTYVLIRAASVYFQLMDDKITPSLRK